MKEETVRKIVVPIDKRYGNVEITKLVTFSIIKKRGAFHFKSEHTFDRCSCCDKISFPEENIADLYAYYMKIKYNKSLRSYFSRCNYVYHLTSQF
jgi:hypothetical protein